MFEFMLQRLKNYAVKKVVLERNFAIGLNSYINKSKNLHFLFLDYDTKDLNYVLDDCKELTMFFNLSDFEVYATNNGFHVFFWFDNNIPYSRLKMIIDYSRCDDMFKFISHSYDYKTVRAKGKYNYKDIIFKGKFLGVRKPSRTERQIGLLKKREYNLLRK